VTARETAALIGYTGFVGGNLLAQRGFDALFNSRNIEEIAGVRIDIEHTPMEGLPPSLIADHYVPSRAHSADRRPAPFRAVDRESRP